MPANKRSSRSRPLTSSPQLQSCPTADERGCGRMEWWVLDGNASAIRFYRSLGSEAMKDWTVFRLTGKSLSDLAKQKAP